MFSYWKAKKAAKAAEAEAEAAKAAAIRSQLRALQAAADARFEARRQENARAWERCQAKDESEWFTQLVETEKITAPAALDGYTCTVHANEVLEHFTRYYPETFPRKMCIHEFCEAIRESPVFLKKLGDLVRSEVGEFNQWLR